MAVFCGAIHFRPSGDFLFVDEQSMQDDLAEMPIRLKRFFLPEYRIGIVDLPDDAIEFVEKVGSWSAEERQEYPELIREWFESGKYVFYCDGVDFYMSGSGHIETT